jgi:hypothetical protein
MENLQPNQFDKILSKKNLWLCSMLTGVLFAENSNLFLKLPQILLSTANRNSMSLILMMIITHYGKDSQ